MKERGELVTYKTPGDYQHQQAPIEMYSTLQIQKILDKYITLFLGLYELWWIKKMYSTLQIQNKM